MALKTRILLVSPLPPPVGGIATWSTILLNYYSKNNINFDIVHQNTVIKYRNITNKSILKRLIGGVRDAVGIILIFRKNILYDRPDLIHLTSSASLALIKDFFLLQLARKRRIPIIMHFHFGRIPELVKKRNWEWYLLCKVIRSSDTVIVIDNKSFTTLNDFGFKNIVNIPNPISFELEEKAKNIKIVDSRSYRKVVFVGHIIENKGVFELVKACSILSETIELLLIGPCENKVKDQLISLAKVKEDGKWVTFTGVLDKNEVFNQLEEASLLVLPSYTEGFPNVVLESMAIGCPVVATDVGAIPEMLNVNSDHFSGFCVSVKNIGALYEAISTLIKDTEKAKLMGENGKKKILKDYTVSIVSSLYEVLWCEVLYKYK